LLEDPPRPIASTLGAWRATIKVPQPVGVPAVSVSARRVGRNDVKGERCDEGISAE
jgi:hypothetical protein